MTDRAIVYRVQADIGDLKAKMAQASASVKETADRMTGAEKSSVQFRRGLDTVGGAAGRVGIVAAAGLGAAVKAAMDWETAWTGVLKTVDGSASQLAGLEKGLRGLAVETGFAHAEVAAVAEAAGQLGISTGGIEAFTSTMLDMGVSTSLSAEDAATGLARLRNIMGTTEADIGNMGSTMVELGNKFATTESEVLAMSMRIAGAGRQAGLSSADVMGLSAAMSSVGIEAEAGGTAMSLTMKRIGKSVEEGGEELDLFARTANMSVADFTKAWGEDAAGTLTKFVTGLGEAESMGMSTNAVLRELGITGIREADALLRLSGNAEGLGEALGVASDGWRENSALTEEAGKFYGTSAQQVKQAWAQIKDSSIEVGAAVLPVVEGLASSVATLASGFQALPGPVKSAVGPLLGLTAIFGGGLWFTAKTIGGIATMRGAIADLGGTAGVTNPKLNRTVTTMGRLAGKAAGVAAVGMAVGQMADSMGRIDSSKLDRAMLAFRGGESTDTMDKVLDDLESLESWYWRNDWLAEGVTVGGLFGDTSTDKMQQNIAQMDEALANYVKTGDSAIAADIYARLAEQSGKAGVSAETLTEHFSEYALELRNAERESDAAADGTDGLADSMNGAATAAQSEADALNDVIDAMREQRSEALRARDAKRNYEAAIDDASASLKEHGRTLDITTEAGRANEAALDGMAAAWNDLSDEEKNATGSARAARKAYVDMAVAMGMPRKEARELARELFEIPPKKVTDVSLTGVAAAEAQLDFLARLRTATIEVRTSYGQQGGGDTRPQHRNRADGGFVPKTGLPYADRHLYMLADGEGITTNRRGETDRFRDVIQGINAGYSRSQIKGMMADGGIVGGIGSFQGAGPRAAQRGLDIFTELADFRRGLDDAAGALGSFADQRLHYASKRFDEAMERESAAADKVRDAESALDSAVSGVASTGDRHSQRARVLDLRAQLAAPRSDASDLDILQGRARVRGLKRSLNAKGDDKLTGLQRKIAKEELAEAEKALKEMRKGGKALTGLQRKIAEEELAAAEAELAEMRKSDARVKDAQKVLDRARAEQDALAEERARRELAMLQAEQAQAEHLEKIKGLEATKSLAESAVSAAEGALDSWVSAMERVGDIATSQFGPDLFAAPTNVWAEGGGTGPLHALRESLEGLAERAELQSLLALEGLSGAAFEQAMRGSNMDLKGMIDRGEVGQFAELWGMFEQASATTAAQAGQYAYGAQSDAAAHELSLAVSELQAVQRALDVANGAQATIVANTEATVAATKSVARAVDVLAANQVSAAARGAATAIANRAAR